MREILFRGKSIDSGEWVYGVPVIAKDNIADKDMTVLVDNPNEIVPREGLPLFEQIDPETVGQYTGLKDENGVKIFEGDIIKCGKYLLLVEWEDCTGYHPFNHYGCTADECEVIGNVYDNQELLEEDKT